jgi:hypothetical protein
MLNEFPILPPLGKGTQFLLSPTLKQVSSNKTGYKSMNKDGINTFSVTVTIRNVCIPTECDV